MGTYGAVNFPELDVAQRPGTHRMLSCHRNVPGVLSNINTALHKAGANILAQQLGTTDEIGYLIIDMNKEASEQVIKQIKMLDENVKTRVLFLKTSGALHECIR